MQISLRAIDDHRKNILGLILFVCLYFLIWSIYILCIEPNLIKLGRFVYYAFRLGLDKIICMALPAYCYLALYNKINPIVFLKLHKNINKGVKYIIIGILILCFLFLQHQYQLRNYINFNPFINIYLLCNTVILAAFMDEIVFRGIILQKLTFYLSFWKANSISSVLFILIHIPKYIQGHAIAGVGYIFIFGLFMGFVLKKSNSLWSCILIHAINNFLSLSLR